MIRNWMEVLFDTLCYLGIVIGLLFFFVLYWSDSYQLKCAEAILDEFLKNVAADGTVTLEQYEGVVHRLVRINGGYEMEISGVSYELQPIYAQIPKEKLDRYYMGRNVRKEQLFSEYKLEIHEEDATQMLFQTETNATILAADKNAYLPLPGEEVVMGIQAARPVQEVYEGEMLITLCKITSSNGSYYVEAEPIVAENSDIVQMSVSIGGKRYGVPVEVICYPRIISCLNGHRIVNSKEIIECRKQSGVIPCPYCKSIPGIIRCNTPVITRKTGTCLEKNEVLLDVTFLDGHTEQVSPEDMEWEDDYDEYYCGIQTVIVRYRGLETTLTIVSENEECRQCMGKCNERYYQDYLTFPYCTECMSKALLFSGEVYEEVMETGTAELMARLDREKLFFLEFGDYFVVKLWKNGEIQSVMQTRINRDGKYR